MSFLQSGQAANSADFRLRVQAASVAVARAVYAEDPATTNHLFRLNLALRVVLGPAQYVEQFAWLAATDAAIVPTVSVAAGVVTVGCTDAQIQAAIASAWNAIAGQAQ